MWFGPLRKSVMYAPSSTMLKYYEFNCKSAHRKKREKGPTAILELAFYSPASYYLRLYNHFTMVACTLPVAWAETQALCPPLPLLVASQPALRYCGSNTDLGLARAIMERGEHRTT
jgi:hypothetical protein